MQVFVGVVEHRHGHNIYIHKTDDGLTKKLAEYCREWWGDLDTGEDAPADDAQCISDYFEDHQSEWLLTSVEEVEE